MTRSDQTAIAAFIVTSGAVIALTSSVKSFALRGEEIREKLKPFDLQISNNAHKWGIPADVIRAVIMTESSGKADIKVWEKSLEDYSYGLMQVSFPTAEGMGFKGARDDLKDPGVNIHYGCRYLNYQMDRYERHIPSMVAAYNSGTVFKRKGKYVNQKHVDRFWKYYKQLGGTSEYVQ